MTGSRYRVQVTVLIVLGTLIGAVGCGARRSQIVRKEIAVPENEVPGTVQERWVEQMPDVVKVPGKLDPTGTYYLPEHETVVEVRPKRTEPERYDQRK